MARQKHDAEKNAKESREETHIFAKPNLGTMFVSNTAELVAAAGGLGLGINGILYTENYMHGIHME